VQLDAMDRASQEGNLDELAKLAHWLKGSAGSVGFSCFTEPAKDLEQAAKDRLTDLISGCLAGLRALYRRIELHQPPEAPPGEKEESEALKSYSIPDAVRSRLPDTHAKFRPIIEKFVDRLAGQLDAIDSALDAGRFDELANLAHWLKGSGGSVGFDHFTEPARDLEEYAKSQRTDLARHAVTAIKNLQSRIVLPGQCAERGPETGSRVELCE
jgi:HPt (histidine-containing phosphotransfer) domain-containing protein